MDSAGMTGTRHDITEHRQAEEALKKSEIKLISILSSMVDLVFAFDSKGRFTFYHSPPSFDELLYLPPEEFIGKHHSEVMPARMDALFSAAFEKNRQGETAGYEYRLEIGGSPRWFSAKLSPVFRDGEFTGSVAVIRDISERKQAQEAIERRSRELAALNSITAAMMQSALDLDEVLQLAADGVVKGLGCNTAIMFLLDEREEVLKARAVSTKAKIVEKANAILGFPVLQLKIPARSDFNEAASNLFAGRITIKHDFWEMAGPLLSKPICSALQRLLGSRTYLGLPLLARGKVIGGIFATVGERPQELSEEDTERLMTFSNQAAIAIDNARLYEETHQRALEQETLREAALALTTALDRNQVIDRILAQLQQVVPYDSASVQLLREGQMELVGGRGFPNLPDLLGTLFPADGDNPNSEVIRTRAPFIVEDAPTVYEGFRRGPHLQTVIRSWLGVPMLIGERLVGMIALDKREPGFYTQEHARLAEAFAAQAAVAFENARLFEDEKRRSTQLALISEVSEKAASILDLDRLMQEVTRSIQESFNYYNVALVLLDEKRSEVVSQAVAGGFEHLVPGEYRQSTEEGIVGYVARTGQSWLANDISQDPHYVKGFLGEVLTASELCVPIKLDDQVIGALDLQSIRLNAFDQSDLAAMETVADHIATSIQNARLYEEMAGLYDIGLTVSSALELDKTLRAIYEQVNRLMSPDTFYVALYDEATSELHFEIFVEEDRWLPKFTRKLEQGALTAWIVQSRKPLIIDDVEKDWENLPVSPSQRGKSGTSSWIGLPLLARDKVVGVISVQSFRPQAFTEENKRILSAFANQAAIAIENARLYEETKRRAQEMRALHETTLDITAQLEMQRLLNAIITRACALLEATGGIVHLYDSDKETLEVVTSHSLERDYTGLTLKVGEGVAGKVVQTGQALIIEDHRTWSGKSPKVEEAYARSMLGVPLRWREQVIGVLDIMDNVRAGAFDEQDLELLTLFANQAAIAIENARLYQETQRRLHEQIVLREAGAVISSALDLNTVLTRIAEQMCRATDVTSAYICRHERETMTSTVLAEYLSPQASVWEQESDLGVSYAEYDTAFLEIMEAGEHDISQLDDPDISESERAHMERYGAQTILYIPLLIRGQIIGFAELWESRGRREFTMEEIALCHGIAQQAAIAIENARLFQEVEERRVYLEGVLREAPDAIITLDNRFQVVEWNAGAERLFGYSQEEAVGQHLDSLVTNPDVFEEATGFTEKVLRGKELLPTQAVRYRKDGSPVDVIVAGSPILMGDEVIGVVAVYTDITERVRMEETLRALALVDDLTGLYNRRGFFTLAEQQLKAAERAQRKMVLLFADFDRLKQINDAFGHAEGDRALIESANVLKETFRESDIIARIGGDEFVVLATETGGSPTEVLAARLQENLEARNLRRDRDYTLSLSLGLARYDPERPCSIDDLLIQADKAMYERKQVDTSR